MKIVEKLVWRQQKVNLLFMYRQKGMYPRQSRIVRYIKYINLHPVCFPIVFYHLYMGDKHDDYSEVEKASKAGCGSVCVLGEGRCNTLHVDRLACRECLRLWLRPYRSGGDC